MPFRHIGDIPPQVSGVLAAMAMAFLRMVYEGQEKKMKRIVAESLICGGLSMAAGSAIYATGLSVHWILFAGSMIGYLGSSSIRMIAIKLAKKKIDKM